MKNVTGQAKKKPKVLICYTVIPFLSSNSNHTNNFESIKIAGVFHRLGFQVDVIHFDSLRNINYSVYSVIFGFGEPFEKSFGFKDLNVKRIYYATGAHVFHQNPAEARRVEKFNYKYGSQLLPKRIVPWCWTLSTTFSDFIVVIGNAWTVSTYEKFTSRRVIPINATALFNPGIHRIDRDVDRVRKEFLWFGSSGLVHKGLDLCISYFVDRPDLTLHICGPKESEFFKVFEGFRNQKNIVYHGFVDVASLEFVEIVSRCLFTILPSCSEGQATSLLTSMGTGLIPIATQFTGVDIEDYGLLIDSLDVESIKVAIENTESIEGEELRDMSKACSDYIRKHHTLPVFEVNFEKILLSCLYDSK